VGLPFIECFACMGRYSGVPREPRTRSSRLLWHHVRIVSGYSRPQNDRADETSRRPRRSSPSPSDPSAPHNVPTVIVTDRHCNDHRSPLDLRGYIPALDAVRGVAILLVLLFHFGLYGQELAFSPLSIDRLFSAVSRVGWIGVDLFFVLSGFLITGILYDAKESKRRTSRSGIPVARLARLTP
jgi:hypothetical protein